MESVSRLSAMVESARDLTLEAAAAAASSGRTVNSRGNLKPLPHAQLKKMLESRHEREVLDGLRRIVSMMYQAQDCLVCFSSVVKNVASPNVEIKKLVHIYLVHYAEADPDLALLSINTIQKSLSDPSPQVRALALRVMSGIRVPVISQIVSLAIKKGCGDMSPQVRKTAALAIPKCFRLDPSTLPQLLDYLAILLGDRQYYVVGSAAMAFLEICPDRIDLIHKHYRPLVRKLVDVDEWGQLALLHLMTLYARKCFPLRYVSESSQETASKTDAGLGQAHDRQTTRILDPDLELLLKSCKSLLASRSAAVVVSAARSLLVLGTDDHAAAAVGPLVSLLRGPPDVHAVVLYNLVALCLSRPSDFVPYMGYFLVSSQDSSEKARLKLEIQTLIFPHCDPHQKAILLNELEHFASAEDQLMVRDSVRAIGRCAQTDPSLLTRCMDLLLQLTASLNDELVAEALTVVRHLIQEEPASHTMTIIRLAKNLDRVRNPWARASIIWLVGEYAAVDDDRNIAPDVLRILLKGFVDESEPAKLQILLLGAKVYLHHLDHVAAGAKETPQNMANGTEVSEPDPEGDDMKSSDSEHPISALWKYLLLLVRYDTSYDLRDRARTLAALLDDPNSTQLANLLILAPKPAPHVPSLLEGRSDFLLGSASLIVGNAAGPNGLRGYEGLSEWVISGQEPDARLREETLGATDRTGAQKVPASQQLDAAVRAQVSVSGRGTPSSHRDKTLDEWLAEEPVKTTQLDATQTQAMNRGQEDSDSDEDEETSEETSEEDGEEEEDDDVEEEEEEDSDVDADDVETTRLVAPEAHTAK